MFQLIAFINTALPLGDKLAFQAGAQYLSHKISNVSYESAVVRYAILREDSIVTRTTFSQANYVEFPLLVKYGISPKWNIYAGLRTSLLLGIKANMTEEHYSNGISSSSTPIENTGKFAQFEGLRSVDFGIPLGVEFSLNRYISLSGTFNYGLTDFTRNKNFSNEQRDKHTSAQIYLIFKPF
ncbi:MAG: PorT family protein [Sphingobacteriales bacterium]|nr:MAG: PorT family protein [Sphingobacteriales bacterium]